MMLLIVICCIFAIAYVVLMVTYAIGWKRQPPFEIVPEYVPGTFISVIIPARNEANNIAACLAALVAQQYPPALLEIIVVDDHSEDDTAVIASSYSGNNVRCIKLADFLTTDKKINSFKKAALTLGIGQSRGALIVTTDADCIAPDKWLLNIAAIYERQRPVMIVAPVIYNTDYSIVQIFQLIDFMSMQGITAAAHRLRLGNMSNGANLAFQKEAYKEVEGYEGITHLASGDDYLLMMKMNKKYPGKIAYLRATDAIVTTGPQPDWKSFLQQRIRWASKSGKYDDARLTWLLMVVYLFNVSFIIMAFTAFFYPVLFCWLAVMLFIKIAAEYVFVIPVAKFFEKRNVLPWLLLLQPIHILYIVSAGFLGFMGGYQWKGRKVK